MRFRRLIIKNWRSFLGTHTVDFAVDDARNITVLVGQNGAGKTALLNAFTWVLFGETTAGFRKPEDLFNHAAIDEIQPGSGDDMFVSLEFDHDGANYAIKRFVEAERPAAGGDIVIGERKITATKRKGGMTEMVEQDHINAILPPGLHPFFFFPAENIGKDIDQNDATSIRASMSKAIDVLLGIERYDNALKIISKALTAHLKSPTNAPRDAAITAAEEAMNVARSAWDEAEKRKKELPSDIRKAEERSAELSQQMDASDAFNNAASEMNKIKAEIAQEQDLIERTRQDAVSAINRNCTVIFGEKLFSDSKTVLDSAHKAGKIPPRVSAGLLDELIDDRKKCICGRELGECELTELKTLRSCTLEDVIAEVASDLRGRVPLLISNDDGLVGALAAQEILELNKEIVQAERRRVKLEAKRSELIEQQPEVNLNDPAKLRQAWQYQEKLIRDYRVELEQITKDLPNLEKEKKETEKLYQKALDKQTQAKAISKARVLLSSVEDALLKIQAAVRGCARKDVERAMNEFYAPLLFKNYSIRLTDDFHHKIVEESTGRAIGVSSSEIALATFAFVGALAALMPVYSRLERLLPADDGQSVGSIKADKENAYPVVLDAPYSPFGKTYAEKFSQAIPDLLPQCVIIVREDQLEYVAPLVKDKRIGSAYVLQLHSSQADTKKLMWNNNEFGYVLNVEGSEVSHTKILGLPVE